MSVADGWQQSSIKIKLPGDLCSRPAGRVCKDEAIVYEVPGLFHRSLLETIRVAVEDPSASFYHYTPFKQYWKPNNTAPNECIYCEPFTSNAYLQMDKEIQEMPRDPDDIIEHVLFPVMVWSDATHLASFGNTSLWPIYIFFGAQTKYDQAKPTSGVCHHLAYIPSVRLSKLPLIQITNIYFKAPE